MPRPSQDPEPMVDENVVLSLVSARFADAALADRDRLYEIIDRATDRLNAAGEHAELSYKLGLIYGEEKVSKEVQDVTLAAIRFVSAVYDARKILAEADRKDLEEAFPASE